MITLRRAADNQGHPGQQGWLTFRPHDEAAQFASGFGPLQMLKEGRLPPREARRKPIEDVEIITYVRDGKLLYEDSTGRSGVLDAGEFQRTTAGRGIRLSETNVSTSEWAHVFQIWLQPSEKQLEPGDAQKRFSRAERHGRLCIVASPDGRSGSLLVHQDAYLYSAILDEGQHVVHPLPGVRSAWLHVVSGSMKLGDDVLGSGDGAGFTHEERAVSITFSEDSEILLLDLVVDADQPGAHDGFAAEGVASAE